MFRILLVDDNPINLHLLQQVLKTFPRPCHVDSVKDGSAALEFLSSRRCDAKASLPHLILMDLNMPRVNGLQALAALKADPELSCIPVIMASTAALPTQVRNSYQAHASCFVRKPTTLEESERLLRGILTFWMEFAVSPLVDDSAVVYGNLDVHPDSGLASNNPSNTKHGPPFAPGGWEARSRTMKDESGSDNSRTLSELQANDPRRAGCEEHRRLLDDFGAAVTELLQLHEQQFLAIVQGDPECNRFDLLIHMANEKKQNAKYAYLRHVESHGCSNFDVINKARA